MFKKETHEPMIVSLLQMNAIHAIPWGIAHVTLRLEIERRFLFSPFKNQYSLAPAGIWGSTINR